MAKMTEDDGGGRGSENPEFWMTSFVNAPLSQIMKALCLYGRLTKIRSKCNFSV